MKRLTISLLLLATLAACNNKPEPIEYGKDLCVSCKMTIMDKKFGAELINTKGKVIKFDSGECMFAFLDADEGFMPAKHLVANYANPGELIEADKAFYLHGEHISSPMGGNLAAFKTIAEAEKFQKELSGNLILWDKVRQIDFYIVTTHSNYVIYYF